MTHYHLLEGILHDGEFEGFAYTSLTGPFATLDAAKAARRTRMAQIADSHRGAVEQEHMVPLLPDPNAQMPDHAIEWMDTRGVKSGILIRTLICDREHS